mgnify:CR=1 FL=1
MLLGHSGSGKTTLAESMLYLTGGTDRLGRIADGNTVCDYDPEEIRRQISISLAVAPVEYDSCKINVLDVPGGFDFAGEVAGAVQAADAAVIVCSAKAGMSVGAEKAWKYCEKNSLPRLLYISKTDEENSDYNAAFNTLRERFGKNIAPVVAPIWDESKKVIGIIDVLHKRAFEFGPGGGRVEIEVPENKKPVLDELYDALKESVAETSEEFMEKFFAGEDFTYAEMIQGLRQGVRELSMFPVLFGSAINCMGSLMLLDYIVDLLPNPMEGNYHKATMASGETEEFVVSPGGVPTAYVFKTISDQYGKYSLIKVLSGEITSDLALVNARTGETEKIGKPLTVIGKKQAETDGIGAGDIGAVAKLVSAKTGDTLCDASRVVKLPAATFPLPSLFMAVTVAKKGDEGKISSALARLMEEDPTLSYINNAETHQQIIGGLGEQHLDVVKAKLKNKFGVEIGLEAPRIAYRESIRKACQKQGRHKKQTGGHGQFGDVIINFEPCDSEQVVFEEKVFGGSVPKNFFPAVEKGVRLAAEKGVLAGYPVVGLKATLLDGSYHPVDSSEMAFIMAAKLAYKAAMPEAGPVILEPIHTLKAHVPNDNTGDIMGDVTKRRGRVLGMEPDEDGLQTIIAEVPLAELANFTTFIRQTTQGRGWFTTEFARYETLPEMLVPAVVEQAKKLGNLDEAADD